MSLITIITAALATFTNVSFSAFGGESFTVSLFVMQTASYIMYFSLEGSGERLRETTDDYINALKRYNKARDTVTPDRIEELREFCLEYAEKDAEYRRKVALFEAGVSEKDYRLCNEDESCTKEAKRAFKICKRTKPVRLTPALLLSKERLSSRCELRGSARTKALSMIFGLLPTTIGTFLRSRLF